MSTFALYHHPTQRIFEVEAETAHEAVLKHLSDTMEKLSAPITKEMREIYLKHILVTKAGSAWKRNALDVFDSGLDGHGRAVVESLDRATAGVKRLEQHLTRIDEVEVIHKSNLKLHMRMVQTGIVILCTSVLAIPFSRPLALAMMLLSPFLLLGPFMLTTSRRWPWSKKEDYPTTFDASAAS